MRLYFALGVALIIASPFFPFAAMVALWAIALTAFIASYITYQINERQKRDAETARLALCEQQCQEYSETLRQAVVKQYGLDDGARICSGEIWLGMTGEMLRLSIGEPDDIKTEVTKTKRKETWKYGEIGKNRYERYVILENDEVVGWRD